MSSDDELSSNTLSSWDVKSLQLAVEGEGSFKFDRSALWSRVVEEGEATKEDEKDKDAIRFATFKSRFKNKETGLNWKTMKMPCHCKEMVRARLCCKSHTHSHMLQTSSFNQMHVLVASNIVSLFCLDKYSPAGWVSPKPRPKSKTFPCCTADCFRSSCLHFVVPNVLYVNVSCSAL